MDGGGWRTGLGRVALSAALAVVAQWGLAWAAAAQPTAGQSLADFRAAVQASLTARGDRMGFALEPCALQPPFAASRETHVGRAFSQREDTAIVQVAAERGSVVSWKEFDLPGLEGWITHGAIRCRGRVLEVVHRRTVQRFGWTGRAFRRLD